MGEVAVAVLVAVLVVVLVVVVVVVVVGVVAGVVVVVVMGVTLRGRRASCSRTAVLAAGSGRAVAAWRNRAVPCRQRRDRSVARRLCGLLSARWWRLSSSEQRCGVRRCMACSCMLAASGTSFPM